MNAFVPYLDALEQALSEAERKIVFDKRPIASSPRDAENAVRLAARRLNDSCHSWAPVSGR